jgi:hypothetical protein
MSTDDSQQYHLYTRREALKGTAAAAAFPLSHKAAENDDGFWSSLFSRDPDLVVTDGDGNVVTEDPDEIRFGGSAVTGIEEVGHPDDTIVRLTVDGGKGFWTTTDANEIRPADGQPVLADSIGPDQDAATKLSGQVDAQGQDIQNVGSIDTESVGITTEVLLAYGPSGELVTSIDPADYSDMGAAINDASSKLPDRGDGASNARYGEVILPPLDNVDYSTTIGAYENLTIRGRGRAATHLNYTGTGFAVQDARGSAGTDEFHLEDLRVDAPNGSFFQGHQLNFSTFENIESNGGNASGSVGIEIETAGSNAQSLRFVNCRIAQYRTPFKHTDTDGSGKSVKRSQFIDPMFRTSDTNDGNIFSGKFERTAWVGGITEDAETTFDFASGSSEITIVGHIVDTDRTVGLDASNLTTNGAVCVVGGDIKSVNDPNDAVYGMPGNGFDANYPDNVVVLDSDGDGQSKLIELLSSGNTDFAIQNRGGDVVLRDTDAGANKATFNANGIFQMEKSVQALDGNIRARGAGRYVGVEGDSTASPGSPSQGARLWYDTSTTPNELKATDKNGTTITLGSF